MGFGVAPLSGPKVLTLDIETSPNLAHVWSLWKQNVSLSQLMQSGQVICFAAKWHDKPKVTFHSDHHDGHDEKSCTTGCSRGSPATRTSGSTTVKRTAAATVAVRTSRSAGSDTPHTASISRCSATSAGLGPATPLENLG